MPITINGSGTVTGITAGGLPDGVITTDDIAAGAVTDAKVNASAAIADSKLSGTTCKAWVNFNGTGTVAIRASYNVSSITDVGVGEYRVNLTTSMSDANYSAVLSMQPTVTNNGSDTFVDNVSTASFVSLIHYEDGTRRDSNLVSLAIFR
jgi:hypothetical protein